MPYPEELIERTAQTIEREHGVGHERARRFALAALDGCDAHGGNVQSEKELRRIIEVVVKAWIEAEDLRVRE